MPSLGEKRRRDLGIWPTGRSWDLGKLVPFEKQAKSRDSKGDRAGGAEILMFTGVRYEREAPTVPTKPTASSSGTKRKRG